ncbi:helix-turn-helix domain-containing protein [Anaerovibrio slackiae]|uniref:helix-turn-helix domain-containing protein n=1 Tax=Anaerovibrio slackiae TaxID=2652309 RepID=UPI003865598D
MQFAQLLKQERMKNKISLRQLAKISGISVASISLYELGKLEPTLRAAHTVFSALGASIAVGAHSGYTPLERKVRYGNGRHAGLNH